LARLFRRILIANRGEVAIRIMRACHEMNIETVCVFSEEDRAASYLDHAARRFCIGPAAPRDSYLKSDRIIAAAEVSGADAIHPGYGFLAENAAFAEKCRASNIAFIGPSADAMRLLGDKVSARLVAQKSKVPTVPGSEGAIDDENEALRLAERIGFPVILKAAAGGGGRGMRIVREPADLASSVKQARQEAGSAFNNSEIYIEKFIEKPRHVEVQVLGDQNGNIVHLGERDCTLQRRHQKLVEESPSTGIDARTRKALCQSAVRICQTAKYSNAGTVEFLVDGKGRYYFIEVNTRIQVEHPVTEMVTGVDLIKMQIRVAAGEPLPFSQRHIINSGHAIECRINAEDAEHNFRPSAGNVTKFRPPGGFGVRVDTYGHDGCRVSPCYDSLLAKLIVHRSTRTEAIAAMRRCLAEFAVEPIRTTIPFFRKVFEHPDFISGNYDTGFIERTFMV